MEVYLVGGAVRDRLLGVPFRERDWVVVGAQADQLLALGYRQVGRDFPVFLHPETGEEYALARTERKSGHGYTGFVVNSDPSVTLEEDLYRRDLTVNAIAEDAQGQLIDPYGGQQDLQARILRHVSGAFVEDPLRVLRVARFAARYAHLGFTIAGDTLELMRQISASGELQHLPGERIWQELERALGEASPQVFFTTLGDCGALQALFPDWQIQSAHLQQLQRSAEITSASSIRFAALTAGLELEQLRSLCRQLRAPNSHRELALLCCQTGASANVPGPLATLELLEHTDAWRRPDRFEDFLSACAVIYQLQTARADYLRLALGRCQRIDTKPWRDAGVRGTDIGANIRRERLRILEELDAERE
ncbi:MAG: multifunctional CCA tRNA nucleotidyl transferase/2'3'-cyclic phosphodiesterase/2'nucleotidase/phosphatase [Gammaproteobacteria bacterium]|nr:multifunctional CCA tRNA nucleotidyl transferase/2'3'-cyclic phosphodiesterase/2'nucleotidase/phosphatase [Gammaproteobacteria bacterium]